MALGRTSAQTTDLLRRAEGRHDRQAYKTCGCSREGVLALPSPMETRKFFSTYSMVNVWRSVLIDS